MAKLLVQESNGAREFELVDLEVNIGRELDNTLRLSDPSISRHHAVIRQGRSGYEIQDLQSSNGVLINGTRVPSSPLHDGDRITLGQMQLTFLDPPAASGAETNPLGTVRMAPEALAKLRASTMDPGAEAEAPPAPARSEAPAAADLPTPAPPPARPLAAPGPKPGPAFLHPFLPDTPDTALPLRTPDGTVVRGDFSTRLLAALIDYSPMLVLGILEGFLTWAGGLMFATLFGLLNLALAIAYLLLFPLYWMRCGASPGKKFMRLRVVPEADPAGRIDLNGAVMRILGYLVNGLISGVVMWALMAILLVLAFPLAAPGLFLAALLFHRIIGLAMAVVPYLLILGAERKGLEDIFSKSIVIKVDR